VRFVYALSDWLRHRARLRKARVHALGSRAEDIAHRYLRSHGYTILARNFCTRTRSAEVDIVASHGEQIVFVEVKSRTSEEFAVPERAVGAEKQRHIVRAAREYALRAEIPWSRVRFDVIAVVYTEPITVRHLADAFRDINHL
jgi:putative endonuclease